MTDLTYSAAFRDGVREEMLRDERVFVMGTDLFERGGHFAQVKGLGPEVGAERVRDAPISEAAMVAAGVGAAVYGRRPLVDLNFVDFSFGAMDEIVNQAAKLRYMFGLPVPLVIRATAGPAAGGAQHANFIDSWFVHTPGLAVIAPSTPYDSKGLIKAALRAEDPVIYLMHKRLTGVKGTVGGPDELVPIGSAAIVRPGTRCTLIGFAGTVPLCLEAAARLAEDGVDAEVIDLRTLYPLDLNLIVDSVKRTGLAVVVDEAPLACSLASEIAASVQEAAFDYLDAPVGRVTGRRVPLPNSPPLMNAVLPNTDDVVAAVTKAVYRYDS